MKNFYKFSILMILIFLGLTAAADVKSITADGFCYLEGASDHSGTKVLFTAVSPSAQSDSTYTDSEGYYSLAISAGIYTVHFSHDGWQYINIADEIVLFENTTLEDVTLPMGTIIEVSGRQYGIWTSDFLYHVVGDISIWSDDTLVIEPGTTIKFMGFFNIGVSGVLKATGTESDSIIFTSGQDLPNVNDWESININSMSSYSSSNISFSRIEYAEVAISTYGTIPLICNNTIRNNQTGIGCASMAAPVICNNTICNNILNGISSGMSAGPYIYYNDICDNGDNGIRCSDYAGSTIHNNIIRNNNGNGIICNYHSKLDIKNNSICNNGESGISCSSSSEVTTENNAFYQNNTGIHVESATCSISYSLFWENNTISTGNELPTTFGEIITVNANGDPCDTYMNLFMDPLFADAGNYNFQLTGDSPCIDAGNPDYSDPDSTIADIGAFYFNQNGIGINEVVNRNVVVFPNPSKGRINISMEGVNHKTHLNILDIQGVIHRSMKIDGTGAATLIPLDLDELPAGVYFICLISNDFNQINKIVIQ